MDTEKPDYFDRYFDEEDEDKKSPPPKESSSDENQVTPEIDDREYFDESLFTEEAAPEPTTPDPLADIQPEATKEQIVSEEPKISQEPIQQEEVKPLEQKPVTPSPRQEISEYDYEDSKIQGINWKPLLIWTTVFIAIVAIGFFGYTWFFANGEKEVVVEQQPTISPQEQLRLEQEKKKIAFVKNIVAEKSSRLNNFSNLSNLKMTNVSYSSVLLYGNSFNFEIFGESRDDIAKYNQNLKKNNYDDNFKIVSVDSRPGTNGGIFALYKVEGSVAAGSGPQADPKIDTNIQATIQQLIGKHSLKLKTDRVISRKKVDQFEMIRKEFSFSGSENNCLKFLNDLNTTNSNFNVHKITLIPSNQKNIKSSKYNLSVIFDFYV